jgi:hypothetical protein
VLMGVITRTLLVARSAANEPSHPESRPRGAPTERCEDVAASEGESDLDVRYALQPYTRPPSAARLPLHDRVHGRHRGRFRREFVWLEVRQRHPPLILRSAAVGDELCRARPRRCPVGRMPWHEMKFWPARRRPPLTLRAPGRSRRGVSGASSVVCARPRPRRRRPGGEGRPRAGAGAPLRPPPPLVRRP